MMNVNHGVQASVGKKIKKQKQSQQYKTDSHIILE